MTFTTPQLSGSVTSVTSATATALTGGRWSSAALNSGGNSGSNHECPPDGAVMLSFSGPVLPSLVSAALRLPLGVALEEARWNCNCPWLPLSQSHTGAAPVRLCGVFDNTQFELATGSPSPRTST